MISCGCNERRTFVALGAGVAGEDSGDQPQGHGVRAPHSVVRCAQHGRNLGGESPPESWPRFPRASSTHLFGIPPCGLSLRILVTELFESISLATGVLGITPRPHANDRPTAGQACDSGVDYQSPRPGWRPILTLIVARHAASWSAAHSPGGGAWRRRDRRARTRIQGVAILPAGSGVADERAAAAPGWRRLAGTTRTEREHGAARPRNARLRSAVVRSGRQVSGENGRPRRPLFS